MKNKISFIPLFAALACANPASAVVATYFRTDSKASVALAPHDFDDGVIASSTAVHGNANFNPSFATYGFSTTLDNANYLGFTVKAEPGSQVTLTDLAFKTYAEPNSPAENVITTAFRWGYRVDSGSGYGAWNFDKTYTPADLDFFVNTPTQKTWDFADFSTTGTVEFGLFASTTAGNISYVYATRDRVDVNGTVGTVPEPSTMLLGTLGVLGLLRRRR